MIAARILSVLLGYVFGLFQTGYIYGKSKGIDIRTEGSGNAGTTNSLRVLGLKAGAVTFIGDLLKAILAVLLAGFIFREKYPDTVRLLQFYAGFGVVLGHNFPFYLGFKGGKGIACTAGVILAIYPQAAIACMLVFILVLVLTHYVSFSSICMIIVFLICVILGGVYGILGVAQAQVIEFEILAACFAGMAIWRHRANIVRLIHGTENKLSIKKK